MTEKLSLAEYRKTYQKPVRIGIDGGRKTGVCVCESGQITFIKTLDFWKAHDFILENYPPETTEIVIEFLNEKAGLYARTFSNTQKGRDRFAANVGSARRETSLLIERFEAKGYTVKKVRPSGQKWSAETFERKTGMKIKTSEHARDAARLIVGR